MTKVKTQKEKTPPIKEKSIQRIHRRKIPEPLNRKTVVEIKETYSTKLITPHHKKHHELPPQKKVTVECIIQFLLQKYPDYKCYVEKARQYINSDTTVQNIREAKQYTKDICKKMNLSFFHTIAVCEAVTSTLSTKGMPK